MITRRSILKWLGGMTASGLALGSYAFAIEPNYRLNITRYALTPPGWTPGLKLRLVALADPHCAGPMMPLARWKRIIAAANELQPDVHLLLGDYISTHRFTTTHVAFEDVADAAKSLQAPLGTYAIMGNHHWWEDFRNIRNGASVPHGQKVFTQAGLHVLDNDAVQIRKNGMPFWLTGTNSMIAVPRGKGKFESKAKPEIALGKVTDDAPIIHLAHEPDLFPNIPARVSLTLSGHTHGGQVRLFGYSPITPSSYGNRFAYGHIVENDRNLIVSGGLGCSMLPVRFGMPPEIVLVELG
jgi:uncharacterized protein